MMLGIRKYVLWGDYRKKKINVFSLLPFKDSNKLCFILMLRECAKIYEY